MAKASAEWDRWLASPAAAAMLARPGIPGAKLIRKAAVRQPIRKVEVKRTIDLSEYDLSGDQTQIEKAIEAGQFSGFRRLNARGEQWKPGIGIAEPPPKPQIAAMPAMRKPPPAAQSPPKPPLVKPYHLETAGPVPADLIAHHERTIEEISAPVLRALKTGGVKFVYADTLTARASDLAGKNPPGWPAGMTWEHSEGAYRWRAKEIIVSRKHKSYDLSNPILQISQRQRAVLFHESGHSLDDVLGNASARQDWRNAWARDRAVLNAEDRAKLAYCLQPGWTGPAETFAELHANELGENTVGADIRPYFPECLKLLRTIIKALP